jgi:hypothetical protein
MERRVRRKGNLREPRRCVEPGDEPCPVSIGAPADERLKNARSSFYFHLDSAAHKNNVRKASFRRATRTSCDNADERTRGFAAVWTTASSAIDARHAPIHATNL